MLFSLKLAHFTEAGSILLYYRKCQNVWCLQ